MTPQLPRIFARQVVRHLGRHKLLALLNVLSVALGVAVFLAIQIANHSATRSFNAGIDLVAGKANLEARGGGDGFDETVYPRLARAPGVRAATPLVEGYLTLPDHPGEYLQLLGLDPFTQGPFATFAVQDARGGDLDIEPWLGRRDSLALSEEMAARLRLQIGDRLRVAAGGRTHELVVRFLLRLKESPAGTNTRVAAMDIAWAQELLGRGARISAVQLLLDDPDRAPEWAERLAPLVPADVQILAPAQRSNQVQRMLAGFQLNLTALSMVSLLVGMFLIYNTIAASVVRRRAEVGILRALGASRAEVQALFLGEAALFGVLGIGLGILGGFLLAGTLVRAVATTISSLYLSLSIEAWHVTPGLLALAFGFGLLSVLAAAWIPAREGARLDPIRALSLGTTLERQHLALPRWTWAGFASLLVAALASSLALTTGPALLGFGSALFVVVGFACFAPWLTRVGGRLAASLSRGRILLRLAAQNLGRSLQRNAITVAALMAAIAMMGGVSIMIHAFRRTVEVWITRTVAADIYVTPAANESAGTRVFTPAALIEAAAKLPGVERVDTFRELGVTVRGERTTLAVVAGSKRDNLTFIGPGSDRARQARLFEAGTVLVSEPFARRFKLWENDRVPIPTPAGVIEFVIGGVYFDYSRDSGVIMMARENFDRHWQDPRVFSFALFVRPDVSLEAVADEMRALAAPLGRFLVYSNRSLRERVFEIFDQTFQVTYVLRLIAVLVAVAGIFLGLTTLVAEREREIGVLRAVGASVGQIRALVLAESGLIGLVASALGVVAGLVLSFVLTFVINKAFFGWTIQLTVPWAQVLATPLWIVPAALLAGWLPAQRAARTPIASAVRAE
ncbi:MAG: ABC transporter permease [Verrucomicrobia bacterium]|nr:ABC transporter permease [Verrucomicrobiota bacterium]